MSNLLTSSRKRLRDNNCEEDCCEFMPLSKRINNLHINNGTFCGQIGHAHHLQEQLEGWPMTDDALSLPIIELGYGIQQHHNVDGSVYHYPCSSDESNSNGSIISPHTPTWMNDQILSRYTPDLDASGNPFYYENNKLLFALYMERMQRTGSELF